MWTVPRAGQLGYFNRTEYNKLLLKVSKDGEEINPISGFKRYGLVKDHVLIQGSVPGPAKRLVRMRNPIRTPKHTIEQIDITYVSKGAKN
jgi:large subunit ribosomal protein L3